MRLKYEPSSEPLHRCEATAGGDQGMSVDGRVGPEGEFSEAVLRVQDAARVCTAPAGQC